MSSEKLQQTEFFKGETFAHGTAVWKGFGFASSAWKLNQGNIKYSPEFIRSPDYPYLFLDTFLGVFAKKIWGELEHREFHIYPKNRGIASIHRGAEIYVATYLASLEKSN